MCQCCHMTFKARIQPIILGSRASTVLQALGQSFFSESYAVENTSQTAVIHTEDAPYPCRKLTEWIPIYRALIGAVRHRGQHGCKEGNETGLSTTRTITCHPAILRLCGLEMLIGALRGCYKLRTGHVCSVRNHRSGQRWTATRGPGYYVLQTVTRKRQPIVDGPNCGVLPTICPGVGFAESTRRS